MKRFLPGVTRKEGTPDARSDSEDDWEVSLSGRTPGKSKSDSKKPVNNLGGPAEVILTTIGIFLISQFFAYAIAKIGFAIISPSTHQILDNSILGQFFYILLAEGVAVLFVFLALKYYQLRLDTIGLGRKPNFGDLGRAVVAFAVFLAILIAVNSVVNLLSPDLVDKKQNLGFDNINNGIERMLSFIALVIIPPLGEEILVRGYLYSGLRKIWNFVPAMLTTSLLFGLAHLELGSNAGLVWAAAIDTFFLSVVLVYLREKTGALYAGMLVHMVNNLLAFLVVIK